MDDCIERDCIEQNGNSENGETSICIFLMSVVKR